MNDIKYPAIPPIFLEGNETFRDSDGRAISTVNEFWRWAFSDLIGNTERGALAEYLVACALGVQNQPRVMWDSYDLQSPEGIVVEVKSSGYIQTWGQKELSKINFNIPPTVLWNIETNSFGSVSKRQSDIYVFCVHAHKVQATVDTKDLRQWEFYLLPTKVLNEKIGEQRTISLSSLIKIGAVPCVFSDLHRKIVELCCLDK